MDLVVVGGGIVGAAITYRFARSGLRVTCLDHGLARATDSAFGWINFGWQEPEAARWLQMSAVDEFHRLDDELNGALGIDWSGALTFPGPDGIEQLIDDLVKQGCPVEAVGAAQIARLEPDLVNVPDVAMFARGDGAVSAESLRESLLAAARDAGAQVWEATVDKVAQDTDGTVAVTSDLGTVRARNVVLANGSDIVRLAQQAGESIRVDSSPAIRYQFAAPKCLSRRILSGPDYEIRPSAPGVYLGAEDFIAHDGPEGPAGRVGGSINAIARAFGLDGPLRVTDIRVGFRPMPQRGQPYVGPLVSSPRILVACVHPGVTLAPAVARRVLDHVTGVRELHAIG